jgi:hypothetical protein
MCGMLLPVQLFIVCRSAQIKTLLRASEITRLMLPLRFEADPVPFFAADGGSSDVGVSRVSQVFGLVDSVESRLYRADIHHVTSTHEICYQTAWTQTSTIIRGGKRCIR